MELSSNEIWRIKTPIVWIMRINALLFSETIYSLRTHTIFFIFLLFTHTHNLFYLIWRIFFCMTTPYLMKIFFFLTENFLLFFHAWKINFLHQKRFFNVNLWHILYNCLEPVISIHSHKKWLIWQNFWYKKNEMNDEILY